MFKKNEKNKDPINVQKISGGANAFPRNDILAFSSLRRNLNGKLTCRACGEIISSNFKVHKCVKDGITYNVYRLNPDKTIWRKD